MLNLYIFFRGIALTWTAVTTAWLGWWTLFLVLLLYHFSWWGSRVRIALSRLPKFLSFNYWWTILRVWCCLRTSATTNEIVFFFTLFTFLSYLRLFSLIILFFQVIISAVLIIIVYNRLSQIHIISLIGHWLSITGDYCLLLLLRSLHNELVNWLVLLVVCSFVAAVTLVFLIVGGLIVAVVIITKHIIVYDFLCFLGNCEGHCWLLIWLNYGLIFTLVVAFLTWGGRGRRWFNNECLCLFFLWWLIIYRFFNRLDLVHI